MHPTEVVPRHEYRKIERDSSALVFSFFRAVDLPQVVWTHPFRTPGAVVDLLGDRLGLENPPSCRACARWWSYNRGPER